MTTHNEDILSLQAGNLLEGLLETLTNLALVLVTEFNSKVRKSLNLQPNYLYAMAYLLTLWQGPTGRSEGCIDANLLE